MPSMITLEMLLSQDYQESINAINETIAHIFGEKEKKPKFRKYAFILPHPGFTACGKDW